MIHTITGLIPKEAGGEKQHYVSIISICCTCAHPWLTVVELPPPCGRLGRGVHWDLRATTLMASKGLRSPLACGADLAHYPCSYSRGCSANVETVGCQGPGGRDTNTSRCLTEHGCELEVGEGRASMWKERES